jgi:iron complex outermembrane receptor protein
MKAPSSLLLCLAAAAAFSPAGFGQVAPNPPTSAPASLDQTVLLPAYQVNSTQTDQYRTEDASSVARVASSILDSPLSVNVISPKLLQDLNPPTLVSAVTYFAGMSPGRGSGPGMIQDRMDFRGFDTFAKLIDDFSQYLQPTGASPHINLDPVLVDHAELVMGPDPVLSPTGTPGGSMNVITKSPLFTAGTDITAQYGNYAAGGVSIDTTGPIGDGKHWAYRVIGDYQEYQTYMPGAVRMATGAAELTYKFTDTAKITVKYFSEGVYPSGESATVGNAVEVSGPLSVGGVTLPNTPQPGYEDGYTYDGSNGVPTWSRQYDRMNEAEAELTAALTSRINMRLAAQVLYDDFTAVDAGPSTTPTETFNQTTGVEIGVTPLNPAALSEIANYNHDMSRDIQVQNDYAGNFDLGSVTLQPLVGMEYEQFETTQFQIQDKNLPLADIVGQANSAASTPYNPAQPPFSAFNSFSANFPENGWFYQGYALMRAGMLNQRLFLTGSWSRTWADVNDYKFSGIDLPGIGEVGSTAAPTRATFGNTLVPASPSVNSFQDEYIGGIVAKPLPNVSVYYSYTTNAAIAGNTPLWQTGKQDEFGVKTELLQGRLLVAVDHFQISENNISVTNPLFSTGQSTVANILADETNHGFEFSATGGITNNLSVIASYTNMHLRDLAGRRVRNVPDNLANLLLNYRFTDGLLTGASVFTGVQHMGSVAGENAPSLGFTSLGVPDQVGYYIAAWNVVNAGAGYQWSRYRVNLNIDNALNSKFWWQPSSRLDLVPYPGLTYRVAVTVHL